MEEVCARPPERDFEVLGSMPAPDGRVQLPEIDRWRFEAHMRMAAPSANTHSHPSSIPPDQKCEECNHPARVHVMFQGNRRSPGCIGCPCPGWNFEAQANG